MGNQRPGAKAASNTSIEISFTYQGIRCRERIKLQPTPANLRKAERHRIAIIEAIEAGTFDYTHTFPRSKKARQFAKYKGSGMKLKDYLEQWIEQKATDPLQHPAGPRTDLAQPDNSTVRPHTNW